jgi:uncharacterized membrane protein YebE (DUF533 family)
MFDARKLLDALVGAAARSGHAGAQGQQPGGAPTMAGGQGSTAGLASQAAEKVQQATGQSPDQLLQRAKQVIEQHPGLAQAAAVALAGILLGKPKPGRGLSANLAKLGGLAVIGGLAYKAWQNAQAGRPLLDMGGTPAAQGTQTAQSAPAAAPQPAAAPAGQEAAHTFHVLDVPQGSQFHPASHTEDDALLFLRAMVAAASADGHIDAAERNRIVRGLTEAGIDPEATHWLDREMASPADVEELSAGVNTPEKAAQVYAAARVAINPDTIQEREFLRQLAEALDLDRSLKAQIDDAAAAIKVS